MSYIHHRRILVSLLTPPLGERFADFSECILCHFGYKEDHGYLNVDLKENKLILSNTGHDEREKILIKHPAFCPAKHLTSDITHSLPEEIRTRGVDVGVAIILESSDGKILLTRRAPHLSTFPGVWVPPGGHLEENESSVYPPMLSLGLPTRHHIVVYFHAQLKDGLTADEMEKLIKFEPAEVDACVWLNREVINAIAQSHEGPVSDSTIQPLPLVVKALTLDENQKQSVTEIPTAPFYNTHIVDLTLTERVSTGTKFALQQYLKTKIV
ncbi:nucleoside diphosphate-linked moiety X motif 17-like isoform X2 [Biomphalaria glabrata]|uniref:Nucleoside diphosphate-linked moiety X motif 17-like isoform X2 n=1 Tax=Biomphalaria glabrata TaxID=6526 RepID=A0A9W2YC08_BIOGL|nr:nucleoside diphosphate-linked moiety X motif 17-like isoform X2 [Biomphalaria glabrata]